MLNRTTDTKNAAYLFVSPSGITVHASIKPIIDPYELDQPSWRLWKEVGDDNLRITEIDEKYLKQVMRLLAQGKEPLTEMDFKANAESYIDERESLLKKTGRKHKTASLSSETIERIKTMSSYGFSVRKIADRLNVSPTTVQSYK